MLEIRGRSVMDSKLKTYELLGAIEDVTEKLTGRREALEFSRQQLLSAFAHSLDHEFQNRLVAAGHSIGNVARAVAGNPDLEELCELAAGLVTTSVKVAGAIWESYGGQKGPIDEVYIADVLSEVVKKQREVADSQRIQIRLTPSEKQVRIFGNKELMRIVIENLLNNAREAVLKAREAGLPSGTIEVRSHFRDPVSNPGDVDPSIQYLEDVEVTVAIIDDGCGLTKKEEHNLFRPGESSKPNAKKQHGYGLWNCRQAEKVLNWKIKVEKRTDGARGVRATIRMNGTEKTTSKAI